MLMALALIPAIVLLVVIYLFDRKDKEPFGLLMGLFFAGAATVISAIILELIGEVLLVPFTYFPVLKSILDCFFVIGPAEELGKYLVLWLITWRNKHFNYSFDGIVYAVFVSLGFAALENISYVFQHGFATGILRMFTSVPGHTCFAVLMGFFYSKSKYAKAIARKGKFRLYHLLSLFVPIVVHALYDALLMVGEASGVDGVVVLCALLWIGFLLALFGTCIALVIVCSKKTSVLLSEIIRLLSTDQKSWATGHVHAESLTSVISAATVEARDQKVRSGTAHPVVIHLFGFSVVTAEPRILSWLITSHEQQFKSK